MSRVSKVFVLLPVVFVLIAGFHRVAAAAVTLPPAPGAQSGSTGLTGTIPSPPPKQGATITTPSNGQSFSSEPITVAGICPKGLLVKIFDNDIFVGSEQCTSGSYSIKIDLFNGSNKLVARVYDSLDQQGPDSNNVTVTFNSGPFAAFGTLLSLTSSYAKRGANPGQKLSWPIIISGGIGPYALSVDWGDGSKADLLSEPFGGTVNISHTYQNAGTYTITIQATDKNGETAFLQVVGVANGPVGQSSSSSNGSSGNTKTVYRVVWWPLAVMLPLLFVSFWLGRQHELFTIRKRLEDTNKNSK